MENNQELYILDTISEGSTFSGLIIELQEEIILTGDTEPTLVPVDLTGASIVMNLKKAHIIAATYSTNGDLPSNTITVDGNKIIIAEHIPTLTYGLYDFDFNITLQTGVIITGFARGQWTILNPITKL